MHQPQDLIERFIKPWLDENHPHAAIVFVAGSYGRALKNGNHQPVSSSDFDLVVIYNDLAEGGFRAASKVYRKENVGKALGLADEIMMVDANVHDFASLHYLDVVTRDHAPYPFLYNMLKEGYILVDKTGIAPILQEKAEIFSASRPSANNQKQWADEIRDLETVLSDLRAADSLEEKRFIGALALYDVSEYTIKSEGYWSDGTNHSARRMAEIFPDMHKEIADAFSSLIREGQSEKAERLMEKLIAKGKSILPSLPAEAKQPMYPVAEHVEAEDLARMRDIFFKFMTGHMAEAYETSQSRGELYHLTTISAALVYSQLAMEAVDGAPHSIGRGAVRYFGNRMPDMLPTLLQAVDENMFGPLRDLNEKALSHMGGLGYTTLHNYYFDDLARVNATAAADRKPVPRHNFQAGFTP